MGYATAVILTNGRLVKQLIDGKSSIYSNRPYSYVRIELMQGGNHINHGETWKKYRKVYHQ